MTAVAFVHPLALSLLALAIVPPLVARRRRPNRRQVVSNLFLWQNLVPEDAAHVTLQRVNRRWLVALQMAIIAFVALALAHPVMATADPHVALVLDASASMAARTGAGTRMDAAHVRAHAVVAALPRHARVRLIVAGPMPRDLGDYSAADSHLTGAIDAVAAGAGRADLRGAMGLATTLETPDANVVMISDQAGEAEGHTADTVRHLQWFTVGEPAENLAITAFAARRLPLDARRGEVLTEIANYAATERSADVEIADDLRVVARVTVVVPARGRQHVVTPLENVEGTLRARLLADDALAMDNVRAAVVPPLQRVRVGVTSTINPFLRHALAANPAIDVRADAEQTTVLVCEGCAARPESNAGVLLITGGKATGSSVPLTIANPHHPIATGLDVSDAFAFVSPSNALRDGDVVLRAGGQPAVLVGERDGRRTVEMRLALDGSTLPFNVAFPLIIANAIDWLAGRDANRSEIVPGDPLSWWLPGVTTASVFGPDGRPVPSRIAGGRLTVEDTSAAGVYRVELPTATKRFAVNVATGSESNLNERPVAASVTQSGTPGTIERPLAPWMFLAAAVLVGVEWRYRRRNKAWRLAIFAALVLAAAGLAIPVGRRSETVVVVLDRSASVAPAVQSDALARVNGFAASMQPDDRSALVTFGADAVVERRPGDTRRVDDVRSTIDDSQTNIAAGLQLARALLPADGAKRIVLVSDGRETVGHADREAAAAGAAGVPIDVIATGDSRRGAPLVTTRLNAPSDVRLDEPFPVSVDIEGAARSRGRLTIYRDDQAIDTRAVSVPEQGALNVAVDDRLAAQGLHIYRAAIEPDGDFADRPADVGAVVLAEGQTTVLCVTSARCTLAPIVASNGIQIVTATPADVPWRVDTLGRYAAVVLDDVEPDAFGDAQTKAIGEYVDRLGGGLLVLGSARTLTTDRYASTALAALLPVDLRPRRGSRSPQLGLVLVFDKSGSMSDETNGTTKIEFARRAAMSVLDVLPETDLFGVVAFDSTATPVAPLAASRETKDLDRRLREITAGGSTRIAPAIELAARWLKEADVSRRQILLVSDGRTSDDDAARVVAAAATPGIDVSAVAIGANADPVLLRRVAGPRGRVYIADDVRELPRIVAREASRSAAGRVVNERVGLQGREHPVLAGINPAAFPALGGYVVTATKPTAATAVASSLGDPVLATWRSGLGRVGVFTADLGSSWSASLTAWPASARLWTQTVRWLGRNSVDRRLFVDVVDREGPVLTVDATQADGSPIHLDDVHATVRGPADSASDVFLNAIAPGRYEAALPTSGSGAHTIAIDAVDHETGADHHVLRGAFWTGDREHAVHGSDLNFLRRLAETSGGRVLSTTETPFSGTRPRESRDVSSWLAALALVAFTTELAGGAGMAVKSLLRRGRHQKPGTPNYVAA